MRSASSGDRKAAGGSGADSGSGAICRGGLDVQSASMLAGRFAEIRIGEGNFVGVLARTDEQGPDSVLECAQPVGKF